MKCEILAVRTMHHKEITAQTTEQQPHHQKHHQVSGDGGEGGDDL